MSVQVSNLRSLYLNLLIKINFLLSNNIQLLDLIIYYLLSLWKGSIDLFNLNLNFLYLLLRVLDHLIAILNLTLEVICEFLFLRLFKILMQ